MIPMLVSLAVLSAPKPGDALDPAVQRKKSAAFYASRSTLGKRSNGAKLGIEAKVITAVGKPDRIEFRWSLDYTGPRQPFTVLAPNLEWASDGQTGAYFYSEGLDGRVYGNEFETRLSSMWGAANAQDYTTAEKGKKATGVTRLPLDMLRNHYTRVWPDKFSPAADRPPVVYVQFWHRPRDRGSFPETEKGVKPWAGVPSQPLDAWTGNLITPVLKLDLKRW